MALSITSLNRDAIHLTDVKNERERVYAAAAVWAGKHIGHDVTVAANEIGTIGFFLPPEGNLLDMFGLLRRREALRVSYVNRIRKELPQIILTRSHFSYKDTLESAMKGSYQWSRFRSLEIGL